jgi:lipoprotein-releasing system permease protein
MAVGLERPVKETVPFAPFEWMLALRYLRARRKEGFISVIAGFSFAGIMLGVATLIIVMAVMNGFRADLFAKILGLNGHVVVLKIGEPFKDYDNVAKQIVRVPGVQHALPLIEGQVMVSSRVQATGGLVRGMSEEGIKSLKLVAGNVQFGTLDGFDESRSIAVGTRLANSLGVSLNDTLTLVSPRGATTPFGTSPRTKSYRITAIFEMGMSEYDRTVIFMPLSEAQRFFGKRDAVDYIEVMVDDPERVGAYQSEIKGEW